jgi:hypothetical protein
MFNPACADETDIAFRAIVQRILRGIRGRFLYGFAFT